MIPRPFLRRRQLNAIRAAEAANARALADATPGPREMVLEDFVFPCAITTRHDWEQVNEPQPWNCPKCGKALKRHGGHLHIRACKGES